MKVCIWECKCTKGVQQGTEKETIALATRDERGGRAKGKERQGVSRPDREEKRQGAALKD